MEKKKKTEFKTLFRLILAIAIFIGSFTILVVLGNTFDLMLTILGFIALAVGTFISLLVIIKLIATTYPQIHNRSIYFITWMLALIILILLLSLYQPQDISEFLLAKHIILFVLLSISIVCTTLWLMHHLLEKRGISKHKKRIIRGVTPLFVIITLTLLSRVQLTYLHRHVIPPLLSCSYYDRMNNLIYNAQYAGSCPELKIITDDDHNLMFTVFEEKYRYDDDNFSEVVQSKYTIETSVTYRYDELRRVTHYHIEIQKKVYSQFPGETADQLFLEEVYRKQIDNNYSKQEVISTHQVYQHQTSDYDTPMGPVGITLADHTFELRSQLTDQRIDVDYRIDSEFKDYFDIHMDVHETRRSYEIELAEVNDRISIDFSDRLMDRVVRNYTSSSFGLMTNIRSDQFMTSDLIFYDDPMLLAKSTSQIHKGSYTVEQDYYEPQYFSVYRGDEPWLMSKIERTNYGYRIKHYSYLKDYPTNAFKQYPKKVVYDPGFKEYNGLSENEWINNYHLYVLNPHGIEIEFVYQKNPLLFEDQLNP